MPTALAKAKAIARALRAARREGQVPEAIVLSPDAHDQLQTAALRYVWSVPKPHSMFGVPVEVDPSVESWAVRMKQEVPYTAVNSPSSSSSRRAGVARRRDQGGATDGTGPTNTMQG